MDAALKIFDDLFLNPMHSAKEAGAGITVTCDSCPYDHGKLVLNVERNNYLKQEFGFNETGIAADGTVRRYLYGTGSGIRTHGIPRK